MSHYRAVLGYFISILLILHLLLVASPIDGLEVGTDRSLADSNASFWGEDDLDQAGSGVSGVGDVNGDGFDDFLIGAVGDDDGGYSAGQTYLFLGKASGWAMDTDLSAADASFWGQDSDIFTGQLLSGAGDVNGDGFDDFIIGAAEEDGSNAGHTYLILGKASGWGMDTSLSDADASFLGENSGDLSSYSISGAGDVNGDGYDDFIIGAYQNYDGGDNAGQTYLILGKASGWAMDTDLASVDASFWGEDAGDNSGFAVSGARDVNGDGFDDFIIGAPYDDDGGDYAGQTYLILGKASGWKMDTDLSGADASFLGDVNDGAGLRVSGAGDVNGDGFDDILIGAPYDGDSGSSAGQTYLILGKASGWAMDTDLSTSNASFFGEFTDDRSGSSVSGAGDVNGDGFDDFIIGAFGNDEGGSRAGQTYLILGKASGWAMDTDLSTAGASFWGEHADDRSGSKVSVVGDVNGDSYDDILIGAPGNADGGPSAGQAYLIFPDRNSPPTTITSLDLYHPDGTFARNITSAYVNDAIHVRVNGTGGNSSRRDITEVTITSSSTSPLGFKLRLLETTVDSNTYDGYFELAAWTHERHHWIGAVVGDTVTVTSVTDPTKKDSLQVWAEPEISETPSDLNITEDVPFSYTLTLSKGTAAFWTYGTNMFWWKWNASNQTFWGTPTNKHVGRGNVQFFVRDDNYKEDHVNMNITVINTPAEIIGVPPTTVHEDAPYYFDFESTDDGQGEITWHLDTTATWLEFNETTGVLSGLPTYLDAGYADVSIYVDDGNGGLDFRNFTIEVIDIIDIPIIITEELPDATEDYYYNFQLEVYDPDYMDYQTWSIGTNATWLEIEYTTGLLSGTPGNEDVGEWIVGVIVTDSYFLQSSVYLTLQVLNVNDLPTITTEDRSTILEDVEYLVDYEATDPDVGDVLTWSLETLARWLNLDQSTGVLSGTPTNDDVGIFYVNVTVSDGEGGTDSHDFTLDVLGVNDPPVVLVIPVWNVIEEEREVLDLASYISDEDSLIGDLVLTCNAENVTIDGLILRARYDEWLPEHVARITVTDGEDAVVFNLTIIVINVNDPPMLAEARCNGELFDPATEYVYLRKGKNDSFWTRAIDEDGDDLEYYWVHDGETVARGNELRYGDLEEGFYLNLTLVVDDGEATTEYTIYKTWVSSAEDEGVSIQLWVVLLLVVAISIALALILVRRSRESGH